MYDAATIDRLQAVYRGDVAISEYEQLRLICWEILYCCDCDCSEIVVIVDNQRASPGLLRILGEIGQGRVTANTQSSVMITAGDNRVLVKFVDSSQLEGTEHYIAESDKRYMLVDARRLDRGQHPYLLISESDSLSSFTLTPII